MWNSFCLNGIFSHWVWWIQHCIFICIMVIDFWKEKKKTTNIHTSWAFTLFSVALRWRIFVSFCSFLCCCCCCCIFSPDFCYCSFFFNHLFNPFPLRVWFRQRAYTYTTFKLTLWMCVRIGMCVLHMRCKHKYPK